MRLDPHGPWTAPEEEREMHITDEDANQNQTVKHNVTAYGYALRVANNLPPPQHPPVRKRLQRKKVMADPEWVKLAGGKDGWVLPEHITAGGTSKCSLPTQLKKDLNHEAHGKKVRSRSAQGTRSEVSQSQGALMFKDELQQRLSDGVEHMNSTRTLHDLRRSNKYKTKKRRDRSRSVGLEDRDEYGSTLGSTMMSEEAGATQSYLGPKTSRLANSLGNTTFSMHEQPTGLSYVSGPTHLGNVANDVMGARWRGGRPGSPKTLFPAGHKGGEMEISEDEIVSTDYPGKQKIGIQRGAGEAGWAAPLALLFLLALELAVCSVFCTDILSWSQSPQSPRKDSNLFCLI